MPSSLARTPRTQQALELSSSSQPGRLSTAMERVIRLERKRAGKVGLQRRIFAMRCGVRARPRLIARSKSAAETTCGAGSHTGATCRACGRVCTTSCAQRDAYMHGGQIP